MSYSHQSLFGSFENYSSNVLFFDDKNHYHTYDYALKLSQSDHFSGASRKLVFCIIDNPKDRKI